MKSFSRTEEVVWMRGEMPSGAFSSPVDPFLNFHGLIMLGRIRTYMTLTVGAMWPFFAFIVLFLGT